MGKVKQKIIIISCYEQQPFHVELISSKVAAMNKQMFEHVRGQREKKACFHVQDVFPYRSAYTQWYLFFPKISTSMHIPTFKNKTKIDKWSCILILLLYHKMKIMVIF